jgi:tetratricopeptide (TPR) repeat protein
MSAPRRPHGPGRGALYTALLVIVLAVIVSGAGSALYITTGGSLFGLGASTFGITSRPDATTLTLQRAREAAWAGRHDQALAAYDSVLADRPHDAELILERARVLAWAERFGEAADALADLARIPPEPPAEPTELMAPRDPADPDAPALDPEAVALEAALQRARYLWWAGRSREADSLLSVVRAEYPDLAEAAELQALVRPSVEPVLEVAARWVAERPDDPASNLWLARALVAEGRAAESLAHYRVVLGEPGAVDPDLLMEAAGVALGADSLGLAGQLLARYLRDVDPPDHVTRLRLARAYSWSGRYTAASEQYRIVLEQAPDLAVQLELARMLASANRLPAAVDEYRRILRAASAADPAAVPFPVDRVHRELTDLLVRAGRHDEAADLLARVLERRPDDHAVRLERARFLWWANRLEEADAELGVILAASPGHGEALALRAEVRHGIDPSVERARAWLAADDSPENRLHLARALAKAERYAEALAHFEAALVDPSDADRVVEAADVADAAGQPERLLALLERHVAAVAAPAPAMLLRLARAYGWAGRHDDAAAAFARYLAEHPADTDVRFELALQRLWGDTTAAGRAGAILELERVAAEDPTHARAMKQLGDLHRWAGDPEAALAWYRRAESLEPGLDSLDEGVRLALEMRDARLALQDATTVAWAIEVDGFTDTEGFDWVGSSVRREWRFGENALSLRLVQGYPRGRPLAGGHAGVLGLGAVLGGRLEVAPGLRLLAELGAISFDDVDAFATWGAGLEYEDDVSHGRFSYGRTPAVRDAATMAALQAAATLDRVRLEGSRQAGPWRAAADLQFQRFQADAGHADRYLGMVVVDRALGETGLALGPMLRAVGSPHGILEAPPLADWGRLYWTPEYYLAPALSVRWGGPIGDGLWLGLRAAPGIAFVSEREDAPARYDRDRTAILETGASLGYRAGTWTVELSGDWGGALPDGYNASSVRLQLSRFGGPR